MGYAIIYDLLEPFSQYFMLCWTKQLQNVIHVHTHMAFDLLLKVKYKNHLKLYTVLHSTTYTFNSIPFLLYTKLCKLLIYGDSKSNQIEKAYPT